MCLRGAVVRYFVSVFCSGEPPCYAVLCSVVLCCVVLCCVVVCCVVSLGSGSVNCVATPASILRSAYYVVYGVVTLIFHVVLGEFFFFSLSFMLVC